MTVSRDGVRLDRFLRDEWGDRPEGRRALTLLLASGAVRVNGRVTKKGALLRAGDEVMITPAADAPLLVPRDGPLSLLHVGATVVVVDKPAGMPSVAGPTATPSVASILLARFPEMTAIEARRAAGLAHRLDTGTSGFLLAARDLATHGRLRAAFASKGIEKRYVALVHGALAVPTVVEHPLARHPRRRGRMRVARTGERAWDARTIVTPIGTTPDLTLVDLRMRTGVTHQLRVHLAALGHPVVGDRRYGAGTGRASHEVGHRLHAVGMRFDDPSLQALLPPGLLARLPDAWHFALRDRGWPLDL